MRKESSPVHRVVGVLGVGTIGFTAATETRVVTGHDVARAMSPDTTRPTTLDIKQEQQQQSENEINAFMEVGAPLVYIPTQLTRQEGSELFENHDRMLAGNFESEYPISPEKDEVLAGINGTLDIILAEPWLAESIIGINAFVERVEHSGEQYLIPTYRVTSEEGVPGPNGETLPKDTLLMPVVVNLPDQPRHSFILPIEDSDGDDREFRVSFLPVLMGEQNSLRFAPALFQKPRTMREIPISFPVVTAQESALVTINRGVVTSENGRINLNLRDENGQVIGSLLSNQEFFTYGDPVTMRGEEFIAVITKDGEVGFAAKRFVEIEERDSPLERGTGNNPQRSLHLDSDLNFDGRDDVLNENDLRRDAIYAIRPEDRSPGLWAFFVVGELENVGYTTLELESYMNPGEFINVPVSFADIKITTSDGRNILIHAVGISGSDDGKYRAGLSPNGASASTVVEWERLMDILSNEERIIMAIHDLSFLDFLAPTKEHERDNALVQYFQGINDVLTNYARTEFAGVENGATIIVDLGTFIDSDVYSAYRSIIDS